MLLVLQVLLAGSVVVSAASSAARPPLLADMAAEWRPWRAGEVGGVWSSWVPPTVQSNLGSAHVFFGNQTCRLWPAASAQACKDAPGDVAGISCLAIPPLGAAGCDKPFKAQFWPSYGFPHGLKVGAVVPSEVGELWFQQRHSELARGVEASGGPLQLSVNSTTHMVLDEPVGLVEAQGKQMTVSWSESIPREFCTSLTAEAIDILARSNKIDESLWPSTLARTSGTRSYFQTSG